MQELTVDTEGKATCIRNVQNKAMVVPIW